MDFSAWIRRDLKPALGVTEPTAIALACAKARSLSSEAPQSVRVRVNSGIYKNAFTCGIPNTDKVGNEYAAALGCWMGDADRGLLVLDKITEKDVAFCERMIEEGKVSVEMDEVSPRISIKARVVTAHDVCEAEIRDTHTNICRLWKNGTLLLDAEKKDDADSGSDPAAWIETAALADMFTFASQASMEQVGFIREAFKINRELADAAFVCERCVIAADLLAKNGGAVISDDPERSAELLAAAAAEARVLGLNYPAMSITGSGNHGIISSMPLYAIAQAEHRSELELYRATALSYLVTMYIKHFSGLLSALCGCAVAAGTGMACGVTMLRGGDLDAVERTLYNMANSIVGMICQGGNHGCVMKVISAVRTGTASSGLALSGIQIEKCHGIGGDTPEETMRNIGLIADPGMCATEETIVRIMREKCMKREGAES